jgi:DNA polymerase elongation subunit (family B)
MGSVALVEQAIINEAHELGFIVPNRKSTDEKLSEDYVASNDDDEEEGGDAVAGAYVVDPKTGIHDWVGSVDINSLYPSTIRTINMSPETLIGQLRPDMTEEFLQNKVREENISMTEALHNLFGTLEYQEVIKRSNTRIWVDFEQPKKGSMELTASEIYELIFEKGNNWCISANGTIFRTDKEGVIPHLLGRWYAERQQMQKKSKGLYKLLGGIEIDDDLLNQLKE